MCGISIPANIPEFRSSNIVIRSSNGEKGILIPLSMQTAQKQCTCPIRMDILDKQAHLCCQPCRFPVLQNFYCRCSNLDTTGTQTFCCMLDSALQAPNLRHHKALEDSQLCPRGHSPIQPGQIKNSNSK